MADENLADDLTSNLSAAKSTLEFLQARIMAGEEVDEKELTMLARMIATQIEEVRSRLEEAVGGRDPEELREAMKQRLSPEEYAEWLAGERERLEFREEFQRERTLRQQLAQPEEDEN